MVNNFVRGVRGAITVERNESAEINRATRQLLQEMLAANHIKTEDICSIFFTVTPDLNAAFPAQAARELGWHYVPLFDALEVGVPGALGKCIRVLMHINTTRLQQEIKHIYLGQAVRLRPDLA